MAKKRVLGNEFPALRDELEEGKTKTFRVGGIRTVSEESESTDSEESASEGREETFLPDVVDFIRRCDTESEALEIIEFMVKRRELTETQAKTMRRQLKEEGLRSFGAKKERDHYLRYGVK
ncbi:MAG: DUF2095 domain-containing protein [Candidatus Thorarchaeota archaeon]|nr:MAG: DUF2095 domain-containing protein [Candidatus Thorarchaeota archaeon]